ncbi:TIGR02611 family protein [Planosporangium sp. 12N6]|uniref:TIGR02611 family protein n=1 Tax=Planosporangium spinosum TaxID=3402278 RepID=UPI003CFB4390
MTEGFPDERPSSGKPPTKGTIGSKVSLIRTRFHALPGGRMLFRTMIGTLGLVLVTLGLALVPLPGPGWLIVLAGIAIWAVEFVWAQQLLRFTNDQLRRWNTWQRDQSWLVRGLLLLALAAVVGATLWLSIKHGLDVDPIKLMVGLAAGRSLDPAG